MRRKFLYLLLVNLYYLQLARAEAVVENFKTDARAKMVQFNSNQIYPLKAHYLISTDIVLSDDEVVNFQDIHLGDAASWDIVPNRNHLYIKAIKLDANGNLNFSSNKYDYHFILSVADSSQESNDQTLLLKFIYPANKSDKKLALTMFGMPKNLCRNPHRYNLQYSFTGNHEQAPIRACDDGEFTYLKFSKQIDLPAIFMVLPNRKEEVLNYHVEGDYVVIERVTKAFTLRNGDMVTSVYNDKYIGDWGKVKNQRSEHVI